MARTPFLTDLSIFLPSAPTEEQRLLVENLRSGVMSRIMLAGVTDLPPERQAEFSRDFATRLRGEPAFSLVNNGDLAALQADQKLLFERRYLLSPAVATPHFETPALRESLQRAIDELASSQGAWLKHLVPSDPTGELLRILERVDAGTAPRQRDGVWVSPDGDRALLMLYTQAEGSDIDGLQQAVQAARQAFEATRAATGLSQARLTLTGPGVLAVESREAIAADVWRLGHLGVVLILGLMWLFLRSPVPMALAALPLISAVLAAAATVGLVFGNLHGLTLGFGIPLIGEAVDYAFYQLISGAALQGAARRSFWSTIRLGVLTSMTGFGALALSGFPGLTQIAVFSAAGLLTAAVVTRFVLPPLTPARYRAPDLGRFERRLERLIVAARYLRWPALGLVVAGLAVVIAQHRQLWDHDIASLNPVSAAAQQLDEELRGAIGAPDVRAMVVVRSADLESSLQAAEEVGVALDGLIEQGRLGGYESPATVLPSQRTQQGRRAALPDADTLRARLAQAADGLPLRAERLAPFVEQVTAARHAPLLTRDDLHGTQLGLKVEALITADADSATLILPLRAPVHTQVAGELDLQAIAAALPRPPQASVRVLDMKAETDRLYAGYLGEAILLSAGGAAAIVALLALSLRSLRAVLVVSAPLAGAVVLCMALFAVSGRSMTLLHLVGLLLVVAVGSNYTLFFRAAQSHGGERHPGMLASLVFANLATVGGFGVLAFSQVPLLSALGATVAVGAALALALSAAWIASPPRPAPRPPSATAAPITPDDARD
ncbi:MAG: MMPL family transporter [Burkholderiaceae bacterium]